MRTLIAHFPRPASTIFTPQRTQLSLTKPIVAAVCVRRARIYYRQRSSVHSTPFYPRITNEFDLAQGSLQRRPDIGGIRCRLHCQDSQDLLHIREHTAEHRSTIHSGSRRSCCKDLEPSEFGNYLDRLNTLWVNIRV